MSKQLHSARRFSSRHNVQIKQRDWALQLVLKAGDATLRATTTLADRFGVRDADVLEVVHAAEKLVTALAQISRRSPETGELVASQLYENHEYELAADLRTVLAANTKKEIAK